MMQEARSITATAFVLIILRFGFDYPTRQDPPPTQSATENFTAVHMMLRFAFTMRLATWSRCTST